jgi:NAD(P)-dependent dehydrogenase (short-subunit alcohol dehydrogenase family)
VSHGTHRWEDRVRNRRCTRIGLGIGRAFAHEGAKLGLVDIDEAALNAARAELGERTSVVTIDHPVQVDAQDPIPLRVGHVRNVGATPPTPALLHKFETAPSRASVSSATRL